jgi:hypothetical protein
LFANLQASQFINRAQVLPSQQAVMFLVEVSRLAVLFALIGLCAWSVFNSSDAGAKVQGKKSPVGTEVRKLQPDFTMCGEGSVQTEQYIDDKRKKCSAIVRTATIDAQEKCQKYIANEAACRLERSSHCTIHSNNVEGCARLVVAAALARENLPVKSGGS